MREALAGKRRARGWKGEESVREVEVAMEVGEHEGVEELLRWEGGREGVEVFAGSLPWDSGD